MICAECGGIFELSNAPIEYEVHGETLLVDGIEHYVCPDCGEELLQIDAAGKLQRIAADLYRQNHRLLTGKEIKEFRKRFSLKQSELEAMIKAGKKAITRWESGVVIQTGLSDVLIRVLDRFPEVQAWLKESNQEMFKYVFSTSGSTSSFSASIPALPFEDARFQAPAFSENLPILIQEISKQNPDPQNNTISTLRSAA